MTKKTNTKLKVLFSIASVIGGIEAFFHIYPSFGGKVTRKDLEEFKKRTPYIRKNKFVYPDEWKLDGMEKNIKVSQNKSVPKKMLEASVPELKSPEDGKYKFTWFGHSSVMIQDDGKNILIDPVLVNRFFPISGMGPKRFSEIPIAIKDLPHIDVVLITHDHHDHLEPKTIKALDGKVDKYIVPLGVSKHLLRWGIDKKKIEELAWWEDTSYKDIQFTCTPSRHFSGRRLTGQNRTEYCSYVIKTKNHQFFDSGDGSLGKHFELIKEKFGEFDLVVMECGQYSGNWHYSHMYPEETVEMARVIDAKVTVPVHWGAFVISDHAWDDSIRRFTKAADTMGLNIISPQIGESITGR